MAATTRRIETEAAKGAALTKADLREFLQALDEAGAGDDTVIFGERSWAKQRMQKLWAEPSRDGASNGGAPGQP